MNRPRLVSALTLVFAGLTLFLVVVGLVLEPLVLLLAVPFGVVAYFMWYQSSGRLVERIYAGVERRARVEDRRDASDGRRWDPREQWERSGDVGGPQGRRRARTGPRANGQRRTRRPNPLRRDAGPTAREAYEILGLSPDADQRAIRRAYRERVKTAHPDTAEGSEEEFKRVTAAYERLTE
ncbi:J domain-containing protein [Halomarina halobia]|uniref:J domain-containing protein n=1 Tax=Halomarina halobia TaxID=3033386 RepID=A0ABD6A6F4_9EURY|nr:J domain-containing protein [Halomarina sp. PSR21]